MRWPEDYDDTDLREPREYVWVRTDLDGPQMGTGTLMEYAKIWEAEYYSGDPTLTGYVLAWDGHHDPVKQLVRITREWDRADGSLPVQFEVGDETALIFLNPDA